MERYPRELLDWAGNRAGGVKKLFYSGSGRPAGQVVKTALLARLERWTEELRSGEPTAPRVILLAGGPGNGKTEAVEFTIARIDEALNQGGHLVTHFAETYARSSDTGTDRLVTAPLLANPLNLGFTQVRIVQDASESQAGSGKSPAALFASDVREFIASSENSIYIACVNRGILDDALAYATEGGDAATSKCLQEIVQSVSSGIDVPPCWPLAGYPEVAVWPMDVESLLLPAEDESPASQIFTTATDASMWPPPRACPAGDFCPFCTSRAILSVAQHREALLRTLRWFELATGKRWNFRDLYSLASFLLAGVPPKSAGTQSPCDWAAAQLNSKERDPLKATISNLRGQFRLLNAQYQHALFEMLPPQPVKNLRRCIAELKLGDFAPLAALLQYLAIDTTRQTTSTLRVHLSAFADHLDPATADPLLTTPINAKNEVQYGEIDRRFSLSVREGRLHLSRQRCLSTLELAVIKHLEDIDQKLFSKDVQSRKPRAAAWIQSLVRILASRIVRRSLGIRFGVTKDADTLGDFQLIHEGHAKTVQAATQQVENLLNSSHRFVVSLNTTFGEPLPPSERRAMLITEGQKVRPIQSPERTDRPPSPVRFLRVGDRLRGQPIALTFDLYKATKLLSRGITPSSLPRSVVALLDITRAKLAGSIVRDDDTLSGSDITAGNHQTVISIIGTDFVLRQGGK